MEKFKKFLKDEELPSNDYKEIYTVPLNVIYDFNKELKVLRPRKKNSDGGEYNLKKMQSPTVPYFWRHSRQVEGKNCAN